MHDHEKNTCTTRRPWVSGAQSGITTFKTGTVLDHAKQTCSYVFVRVGAVFPTGPSLQTSIKDP